MSPDTTLLLGTLGGTLIGSLIGLSGTWLTMRYQHRIKNAELSSQSRLKAKELLFKAHQDRITRIQKRAGDWQEALGTFLGFYNAIEDENERKQLNEGMFALMQQAYEFRREWFTELKEERHKVGLDNTSPVQMAAIEKSLEMDVSNMRSQAELNQMIINLVKMIASSDSLWQDVLSKKCEDLFAEDTRMS